MLPVAINYHTAVAISPRQDRRIRALALDENGQVEFALDDSMVFDAAQTWSNYLRGVIAELRGAGYKLHGADLTISGNVPLGAGLSSSAALEIAIIRALALLSDESVDSIVAARLGQAAENNFVGCNCGIMDQLISARGRASHALLIDCRDLHCEAVPMPSSHTLLVVNSNVKRQLVDGEYNARRAQCEAVAAHFEVPALRDVSLDQLLQQADQLSDEAVRRARHVITENNRTSATAQALKAGDMKTVARLMGESHRSMRDDFEITISEIDTLVEIVQANAGSTTGVRMTGGGFGGCVIALVPESEVAGVIDAISADYPRATGSQPTIFHCIASDGAYAEAS